MNAIHAARTAFIASENDEKIRRALKSNIRTTGEVKYVTGDKVFYKRDTANQWHGPATVIGQVDQQVFVKHGSFYIRVHPCRLQLKEEASRTITRFPPITSNCTSSSASQSPHNVSRVQLPESQVSPAVPQSSSGNVSPEENDIQDNSESNIQPVTTGQLAQREQVHLDDANNTQEVDDNKADKQNVDVDPPDTVVPNHLENPSLKNIKPGVKIRYIEWEGHPVNEVTVKSRAAKATSKNKDCWNTTNSNGENRAVHFAKLFHWEVATQVTETAHTNVTTSSVSINPEMNSDEIPH